MSKRYTVMLALLAGLLLLAAQLPALAQSADLAGKCRELQNNLVQYKSALQGGQTAMVGVSGGQLPLAQVSPGPAGYLRSLSAPAGYHFLAPKPVKGDPTATAKSFLSEYGVLFGVTSKSVDFAARRISSKDGRRYVHLRQQVGGITVFAGEMVVQVSEADGVEAVVSDIGTRMSGFDSGALSLTATTSSSETQKNAVALLAREHAGVALSASAPMLCVYDPQVVGNEGPVELAWETVVVSTGAPIVNEQVLLSAYKGTLLLRYTLIKDTMNRQIYDAANVQNFDGDLVRSEGQAATGIAEVDKAYNHLGDAYIFYLNEHQRDSIDGAGMPIIGHVRYGPMENAFWDPETEHLYFGQGFAVDDVVAHEYTHGVTEHESGLIYMNESGAINEAFSDIWGEFIDLTNGRGNDSPAVRWLCGEDLPSSIGVIRSLANPPLYGLPDRMGSPLWYTGAGDNGGVHTNMGVGSKLAYLLTDGATFNGYTITGMGIPRVADLFYEVQTNLLTSGADYTDLYGALAQAALNLAWTASERTNLSNACSAVEICNDNFAGRKAIGAGGGTQTGSNVIATKEPGEPDHAGNAGGKSLWWTWTPAVSGTAQIDTIGSSFDTLLGVYTGSSVSALTPVASDDNSGGSGTSMVTFSAVAGTAYQIAVDGYNGASGAVTLHVIAPPPANDNFAGRAVVSAGGGTVAGTNAGATKESGEPNHAGNIGGKSVWWTWTPAVSGMVQIDTIGSSFDTVLGVYTGSSVSALTIEASNDDVSFFNVASKVTLEVVAGTEYLIAVDGYDGAYGSVTLNMTLPAGNDDFANRTVIGTGGGTVAGTNAGATQEPGEPDHAGMPGGTSVWWTWTPAASGTVQIDTIGSNFDTLLGVYTGSIVSALTPVASDDQSGGNNTSRLTFAAVAGTQYQIAVDGFFGDTGSITLHVISVAPPANDNFANRIVIGAGGGTVTGTNAGATKESGEPNHAGNSGGKSVWWTWTPAVSGTVQIDTIGSGFDTLLGVYTGSSVSALTLVASNDDADMFNIASRVTFSAAAGTAYRIAVDGYGGGSGSITLHALVPASNNNFANRIAIAADGATMTGTNVGATKESGEPNHAGNSGGKSVWWTWTPRVSGSVQIDTIGSSFDTLLGVYTGSSVSALTLVTSDDESGGNYTSRVSFAAVAGTAYQIAVDGYGADAGGITLHAIVQPPANDDFANRITVSADGGPVTGANVCATKEPGEPNHAGDAGGKSAWWTWTPATSGTARIDTIGSDFDTTLAVYTGSSVSGLTLVASDNDGGGGGGASNVTFSAEAGTQYQIAVDGFGGASGNIALNVIARDLAVLTASLPDGCLGMGYSQAIAVVGGLTPYTWSVSSGTLPEGLSINASTGEISGTPTATGMASFTVTVTDSATPAGTVEQALSIAVGIGELEITTTSLPIATRDALYSQTLAATGGIAPYGWSVAAGALPAGLSLDASTGAISGTPTATGTCSFTAQVTDSQGTPASATAALSIAVNIAPTYQYLSSDPESATTNTNYVNKVNMTLNTAAADDWIIFGFCEFKCPNVNYATFVQLFIDGAGEAQNTRKPVDPTDYLPFISVKVKNLTAGAHTIQLKYRSGNLAAAAYVRNARVCAVRKAALEFWNVANDNAKPLTINSTDIAVLTWTPATTGNYLVISTAELNATTAVSTDLQTIYNGVVNDEGIMRAADNGDYTTFMSFNYCANAPAGVPITHKITGRKMASSTANHYIRRARILALRLSQSRFNNTAAGSGTEKTTVLTTFQEALTTTWTYGVSGSWLFLNSARVLNTSTSYQTEIRVQLNNSVTCADQIMKPKAANDLLNFSSIDIRALTTPRQVDMDYRTTNAAGTAKVRRLRFYGLPLDAQ